MIITTKKYGQITAEVHISPLSAVDSYIYAAWNDDRDLTEDELEEINKDYEAEIQDYAWRSGRTRNHN